MAPETNKKKAETFLPKMGGAFFKKSLKRVSGHAGMPPCMKKKRCCMWDMDYAKWVIVH